MDTERDRGNEGKPDMVRVNTRISHKANEWLDNESRESGVPKSTLILLAIENYIREKTVMDRMADMGELVARLDEIQKAVQRNDQD